MTSSKQPTILQLIPELATGGAERGAVDVAIAIQKAGGRALVVSAGGRLVPELERAGARHILWPSIKSKNPFKIIGNARKLQKLIRDENVHVVHARSRAPAWSGYRAAKATGLPFMTTFHAPYNFQSRLKKAYNAVMARGQRIIAVSEFVRQHVIGNYQVSPDIVRTIHRGVDLVKFDPIAMRPDRFIRVQKEWRVPDDKLVILLPGRLTRWKGQRVLIEAMAQLKDLPVVAVCAGGDQGRIGYRKELDTLIHELGLEGRVRLPGDCTDMPAAYALASVVLSCSIEPEAFGRVIAEAQAMGKPVIASNLGAVAETVKAGGCGWVVDPGNADELASAIRHVLTLPPAEHQRIRLAARAFVAENYSREQMCDKTLGIYNELLPEDAQLSRGS